MMVRIAFGAAAILLTIVHASAAVAAPRETFRYGTRADDLSAQQYAQIGGGRTAPPAAQRRLPPVAQFPTRVYLLRGFMNVFSLGMDDLANQIRANGVAATVTNHADIDLLVPQIVSRYQAGDHGAIVIIGHSLGADAVIDMAQALDRYGIPVAAAILFDGTEPHVVPANVTVAVNYTLHFSVTPGPGFRGTLSNVSLLGDQSIDHLNIEKSPTLQAQALNYVLHASSRPGAAPAPAPTRRP